MCTVRRLGGTALATAAMVALSTAGATAEPEEATHIDELTATVGAADIAVSGQASFVDAPVEVGNDPVGDSFFAELSGGLLPAADDLTTITMSRPDPFGEAVTFTAGIANQPPTLDGVPEFLAYRWPFTVTPSDGDPTTFEMVAMRSAQWTMVGSVEPQFMLFTCPQGPVAPCEQVEDAVLTGTIGDGVVEWTVPAEHINAGAPSVISPAGGGVEVVASASSLAWSALSFDDATISEDYIVPAATIEAGLANAGTAPDAVPLTVEGDVLPDGTFDGVLPRPAQSGSYTVVVRACYGLNSCALASVDVEV